MAVRGDFPILQRHVHGKPLVYLDNAATTQKPRMVVDRLARYYTEDNANTRGVHRLSEHATAAYEAARDTIRGFLNAADSREMVFVRGTTEGINLVAQTYGRAHVDAGDEIVISEMEHHSNIVPWQILAGEKSARLRVIPITDAGELRLDEYDQLLNDRTRIVAVAHVSNALGTINPVAELVRRAHARWNSRARGRSAGRCAHASRRPGARLRFLRVLGPQGVRPDRHRRALGPRTAARDDAAPGRPAAARSVP
jgi:cysteine desulfurase/selenocysteine lyase